MAHKRGLAATAGLDRAQEVIQVHSDKRIAAGRRRENLPRSIPAAEIHIVVTDRRRKFFTTAPRAMCAKTRLPSLFVSVLLKRLGRLSAPANERGCAFAPGQKVVCSSLRGLLGK